MLVLNRRTGESLFIGDVKLTVTHVGSVVGLECDGVNHMVRPHKHLVISDAVTVFIADRKGRTVRLGIDAPRDVLILREELKK